MPSQDYSPPTLVMRQGPEPHQSYILEREITTIGRDIENDIVIDENHLSAHHALVTKSLHGWVIEDLGSKSGVWVYGYPIEGPVFIRQDVRINLGPNVTLVANGQAFGKSPQKRSPQGARFFSILFAAFIVFFLFIIAFLAGYYFLFYN